MSSALASQRELFDIPDDVTYLNCAYMAPQLKAVTAAGVEAVGRKTLPWTITAADFFAPVEEIRGLVAALIGGDADGVALAPSAAYGITLAAENLPVGAGQRIVVLAEQFPSNVYPWTDLAARTGAEVVTVARPSDGDWTPAVLAAIDERTAVAALPHCHWTDGSKVDLERVSAAVRQVGAALVVDASQSLGAVPFDVAEIRPDFLIAVAYKWLLGPYSLAYLWAAPDRRSGRPLEFGWSARAGSEDFARLVDYRDDYRPGARRYDAGETSDFVLLPMAAAALRQILDWGVERIAAATGALTRQITADAEALGLQAAPERLRGPHLLGVRLPSGAAAEVADRLRAAQVHVSVRGDSIRISPHLYNDLDDVGKLRDVLASAG